jgi:hypothetical protein
MFASASGIVCATVETKVVTSTSPRRERDGETVVREESI